MIRLRGMWTGLVLGSAIISRQSLAQSSVSLTHVVSVTVPARVKAQVTSFAPAAQMATRVSSVQTATDGLVITVNATQAWTLSIGSAAGKSKHQWSHDAASGFARVDTTDADRTRRRGRRGNLRRRLLPQRVSGCVFGYEGQRRIRAGHADRGSTVRAVRSEWLWRLAPSFRPPSTGSSLSFSPRKNAPLVGVRFSLAVSKER